MFISSMNPFMTSGVCGRSVLLASYCTALFILQTQSQAQSGDSTDGAVIKSQLLINQY